jgi:hypothetical protein
MNMDRNMNMDNEKMIEEVAAVLAATPLPENHKNRVIGNLEMVCKRMDQEAGFEQRDGEADK